MVDPWSHGSRGPDRLTARRPGDGQVVDGHLFVASEERRAPIRLPGLVVQVRPGEPHDEPVQDPPWVQGLRISSPARTLVDNLAVSRSRGGRPSRTLSPTELQDWLANKSVVWRPRRIKHLHEQAVKVAETLDLSKRIEDIDRLFDQLAERKPPNRMAGKYFKAVVTGGAWDERRAGMFQRMADGLKEYEGPDLPDWLPAEPAPGELPFFESYFSNYIEGTIFTRERSPAHSGEPAPPAGAACRWTRHPGNLPLRRGSTGPQDRLRRNRRDHQPSPPSTRDDHEGRST